jgi:uncharacterized protein (TIGR02646 family)
MKHIDKKGSPENLNNWKENWSARNDENVKLADLYTQEGMTGDRLWRVLSNPKHTSTGEKRLYSKEELKEDLIVEQGFICCYCNREIAINDVTIEHFKEKGKSEYFDLAFDYDNLLLSCDGYEKNPKPRDICCNTKRPQNSNLPLSPLQNDIEEHFDFIIDGQIIGKTDKGNEMIGKLGLDIFKLEALRESAIRAIVYENPFDTILEYRSKEAALEEKQRLQQLENKKFEPFCTAIIKVLENEIINIL